MESKETESLVKEMNGFSRSFNIVDQDRKSVGILCRVSWEFSDTIGDSVMEEVERMMWDLTNKISNML